MKPLVPVWLFTFSVLFLLNAGAVQAQIAPHNSHTLPVAQARNTTRAMPRNMATNVQNVQLLGHFGGETLTTYVVGQYAYIGEGVQFTILDIANAMQPQLISKLRPFPGDIQEIEVNNNLAYVADGSGGLRIVDVANPSTPKELGFYQTAGFAYSIDVVDKTVYLADGSDGLRILDVANPAAPKEIGFYQTNGVDHIKVVGNIAYMTDYAQGLSLLDISNPAAPQKLGAYHTNGSGGIAVVGNIAYMADFYEGVHIFDVSNPTAPKELSLYQTSDAYDVYAVGNIIYVADWEKGLQILDVTNPTLPKTLGAYSIIGANSVYVVGATIYLSDDAGLYIMDATNLTQPKALGSYRTGPINATYTVNNRVYLVDESSAMRVIDVTNPAIPKELGSYKPTEGVSNIAVVDNTVYVATPNGLRIVDMTNPAAPKELGAYLTSGGVSRLFINFSAAYLITSTGLHVIDITDPAALKEVGAYQTPGGLTTIFVVGNLIYMTDGSMLFHVVSLFGPTGAKELGSYQMVSSGNNIFVLGNIAYVATNAGLRLVDVSNPANPKEISAYSTGYINNVYVVGATYTAYVADSNLGLLILDVSNPVSPKEIGSYPMPVGADDLFITDNAAYVAAGISGLYILRYPPCYRLTLHHTGTGTDPVATPPNSTGCLSGEYHLGELITFSAHPADSWKVVSWVGTSNDKTESPTNVLTMPATDQTVTVNYAPTCYALTLTHSGTGGDPTATPPNSEGCPVGQYVASQSITLHSTPGTGYTVGSWQGTANDSSTASDNTLVMPAHAQNAIVLYRLACYTLTLTHNGSGSDPSATPAQSPDCTAGHYHYNETIQLAAQAEAGWQIVGWSGATNTTITGTVNSLSMPPAEHAVSVSYGEAPKAGAGDSFESDGSCTRSRPIAADGSEVQEHTFHAVADVDWLYFNAAAATTYRIEVQVPQTSQADVTLELYTKCDGTLAGEWKESFSPGARLDFAVASGGPVYIRLANQDANVAGAAVRYTVAVRALAAASSNRVLILVAGRLRGADTLQRNIDHVASEAYKVFQRNGYTDETINFLATDASLPGYDAAVTRESLHSAIATWAKSHLQANGVLTLYLVDHGSPDLFYLDELSGQRLTPDDLDSWLSELETAVPNVKINVIIEACESGSFIVAPHSISKPGRLVITSSNAENDAKASKDGAYFSDHLLTWLRQGYNLAVGFNEARTVAQSVFTLQQAMLDSNGNGITNEASDITIAAGRSFAYAGTLGDDWPPYIFAAQGPPTLTSFSGVLQADVRDNQSVREVWAVVYPPDYTPPPTGDVLQAETQPTILLARVENGDLWRGTYTGFTQPGIYRIVIQADDNEGLKARPFVIEVNAGSRVFLPLVRR